jgi:Ca2+-binding EF-hand superfamily protein
MTRYWLVGIVTGIVALSQVAAAQDPQKTTEAKFESLDKDRDGKVSINEATEHDGLFVAFKDLDKDKDGALTKQEFEGFKR